MKLGQLILMPLMLVTSFQLFGANLDISLKTCSTMLSTLEGSSITFVRPLFQTEVSEQLGGACHHMSSLGHLENLLKHELNSEWHSLKILEKFFFGRLANSSDWWQRPDSYKHLDINFVAAKVGHGYWIMRNVGVVDKNDFELPR